MFASVTGPVPKQPPHGRAVGGRAEDIAASLRALERQRKRRRERDALSCVTFATILRRQTRYDFPSLCRDYRACTAKDVDAIVDRLLPFDSRRGSARRLATTIAVGICVDHIRPAPSRHELAAAIGASCHSAASDALVRWRTLPDETRLAWRQAVNANLPSGVLPIG